MNNELCVANRLAHGFRDQTGGKENQDPSSSKKSKYGVPFAKGL